MAARGEPLGDQPHRVLGAADAVLPEGRLLGEEEKLHRGRAMGPADGGRKEPRHQSRSRTALPSRPRPEDRGMTTDMAGGPIFLLGIQRGGTNQLLNVLRSHPATYWPGGEFHEVFRPRSLRAEGPLRSLRKLARYAPILLDRRRHPRPRPAAGARRAARRGARGRAVAAGLARSAAQPPLGRAPTRRRCAGTASSATPRRPTGCWSRRSTTTSPSCPTSSRSTPTPASSG